MSGTLYLVYVPDLPIETFGEPASADRRRRELLDHGKLAHLFAMKMDPFRGRRLWREWIHVAGRGSWQDVETGRVPFRLLAYDKP